MAAAVVAVDLTGVQDALRPARSFINTLAGLVNEQSYAYQDAYAVNQPMQYQIIGNNGAAIEGTPYYTAPTNALGSNRLLIGAIAIAVAFFVLSK